MEIERTVQFHVQFKIKCVHLDIRDIYTIKKIKLKVSLSIHIGEQNYIYE